MPETVTKTCITLIDVGRTYDMGAVQVHALKNVNLDIPRGQFIVILGPSGSGKTTLLNLLGAIDIPTEGNVQLLQDELTQLNRAELARIRRDSIGFVFQFFNLLPSLTARENVEYALQIRGKKHTKERALEVLSQVGLFERADHFPGELSGGEQQRVAIARALAKAPPIILADEPTGELDYETGIAILELLHELSQKGHTVVMVTHNSEIARIADRVVKLRSGEVVSDELNPNPIAPKDLRW
jgi:putative ABC transport system ATP-binding protein